MPENQLTYKDLINKIEATYPVNKWIYNGYHIWPVLRIHLYMILLKQNEDRRDVGGFTESKNYGFFSKLGRALSTGLRYHFLTAKKYKKLYFGAPSYRVEYSGKLYNKYFDPFIDEEGLLIEYRADSKENFYESDRIILLSDLSRYFRLFEKKYWKDNHENQYTNRLNEILLEFNVELKNFVSSLNNHIYSVDRSFSTCYKILKKVKPVKIYMLCYYSNRMLGLNIAAEKLNIPTYEMQHGPQGAHHLAYGSWKNVPEQGYEALPNVFNTWDESSAKNIEKWANRTTKHSAKVTGNPWVDGWKRGKFETSNYQWPDKLILYTLQPTGNPLESYLLEAIKRTSDKWNWWLRLHPRQMGELEMLKNKLGEYCLLDKVNIDDATRLLLPEILVHTKVHLTKFSGCAIEAFSFETPTIILDKRGEEMFKDYFEDHKMVTYTGRVSEELISKVSFFLESSHKL